jgi:hypothetical protein
VIDKNRGTVYVGTDVGVFHLKNGKENWHALGTGLPLAPVLDIRLHDASSTLVASTFGRSMWKLDISGAE